MPIGILKFQNCAYMKYARQNWNRIVYAAVDVAFIIQNGSLQNLTRVNEEDLIFFTNFCCVVEDVDHWEFFSCYEHFYGIFSDKYKIDMSWVGDFWDPAVKFHKWLCFFFSCILFMNTSKAFNTKPAFSEVNYIKNSVFCLIYLMRNVCFACAHSYLASGNFKVPGVLIMKIQKHVKTKKKSFFVHSTLLLAFS